jgi:hypothetical protein
MLEVKHNEQTHIANCAQDEGGEKAAHISFLPVCVLKAWPLRKCRLEAGTDWRHHPHH